MSNGFSRILDTLGPGGKEGRGRGLPTRASELGVVSGLGVSVSGSVIALSM